MRATHSSLRMASLTRSLLSFRRGPLPSTTASTPPPSSSLDLEADSFQSHVTCILQTLLPSPDDDDDSFLSLSWLRRLLDSFLSCDRLFRSLLSHSSLPTPFPPPLHRTLSDFLERTVKALDVFNAVHDGIDHLRGYHSLLDIALDALRVPSINDGRLRRARKALADLSIKPLNEDRPAFTRRNRSFGRNANHHQHRRSGHSRSLSWSMPRNWSAVRQLQAIGNSLVPPKCGDTGVTNAVAVAVFCMSWVLLFVLWVLLAVVPCQDRAVQSLVSIPRSYAWAVPMVVLHEQIVDESRRRKGSNGLLRESQRMERCVRQITELTDVVELPLEEEKAAEVREELTEMARVYEAMKDGLDPLERKVREVFREIVKSRTEGMEKLGVAASS